MTVLILVCTLSWIMLTLHSKVHSKQYLSYPSRQGSCVTNLHIRPQHTSWIQTPNAYSDFYALSAITIWECRSNICKISIKIRGVWVLQNQWQPHNEGNMDHHWPPFSQHNFGFQPPLLLTSCTFGSFISPQVSVVQINTWHRYKVCILFSSWKIKNQELFG